MAEFPPAGTSPKEFFESWLPKAFGETPLPAGAEQFDVKLGVKLDGDGGGEWVVRLSGGSLDVGPGPRDEAAFTIVQSVDDWRGSLWEGRGGIFGAQTGALFRPGSQPPATPGGGGGGAPNPAALAQLRSLDGLIRMVVTGGTGGDWSVAFKLGPGAIPADASATVTLSSDDAEAMQRGELDPVQAFMSGRIQIAGDMGLIMQMQAIQMQAASSAPSPGAGSPSGGAV